MCPPSHPHMAFSLAHAAGRAPGARLEAHGVAKQPLVPLLPVQHGRWHAHQQLRNLPRAGARGQAVAWAAARVAAAGHGPCRTRARALQVRHSVSAWPEKRGTRAQEYAGA
jgi:hypothetical protein